VKAYQIALFVYLFSLMLTLLQDPSFGFAAMSVSANVSVPANVSAVVGNYSQQAPSTFGGVLGFADIPSAVINFVLFFGKAIFAIYSVLIDIGVPPTWAMVISAPAYITYAAAFIELISARKVEGPWT